MVCVYCHLIRLNTADNTAQQMMVHRRFKIALRQ